MSENDRLENEATNTEVEKDRSSQDPEHFADGRMPSSAMRSYGRVLSLMRCCVSLLSGQCKLM